MFEVGQGILGKIIFNDGIMPNKYRTYIIVDVSKCNQSIKVLNVSYVKGQENKLAFPYNIRINKYNPPFLKDCFVKLDSITEVDINDCSQLKVLNNGNKLDTNEMNIIIKKLNEYLNGIAHPH